MAAVVPIREEGAVDPSPVMAAACTLWPAADHPATQLAEGSALNASAV